MYRREERSSISAPISFLPAVGAVALPVILAIGGAVIGVVGKAGAKKAAKYGATYAAEKGIEKGSTWAKSKLRGGK